MACRGVRDGRAPEGHDGVADHFVDGALLQQDQVHHVLEVFGEVRGEGLGGHPFADGGEAADVREHHGDFAGTRADAGGLAAAQQFLDHLGGDVARETVERRAHVFLGFGELVGLQDVGLDGLAGAQVEVRDPFALFGEHAQGLPIHAREGEGEQDGEDQGPCGDPHDHALLALDLVEEVAFGDGHAHPDVLGGGDAVGEFVGLEHDAPGIAAAFEGEHAGLAGVVHALPLRGGFGEFRDAEAVEFGHLEIVVLDHVDPGFLGLEARIGGKAQDFHVLGHHEGLAVLAGAQGGGELGNLGEHQVESHHVGAPVGGGGRARRR
ncbi:MAG: hypothetical protein M5U26_15895 [Planctomycetota bacterium]|nr:hypothetical protein [Planctomycetota bacterium]